MKIFANSSKGFVSLTFAFILMSFVSLYLTGAFAIALSQQRDYVRSTCVQEATKTQISTLENVRALFEFNTTSTTIRSGIKTTKAAIAIAVIALQFEAIPPLQKALDILYKSQKILDGAQKVILNKARIELLAKHYALIAKINSGQRETAHPWRSMISMWSTFIPRTTPTLAIRPDSEGGVGPNYEWLENAESEQNLAYSWNMYFKTSEQYQRFFTWMNVLNLQCSVAPDLRGKKWGLKISADK